ncbi:hypothetical protein BT93_F1367 [Corymbia citriodora subsp. variegata]|nr:hypothetical protein BT93_F1367 [Corymbia citriodora subsp. variegata]KAF8024149.1 hypothetical protein BT93_F1367 [Corymbia citriodora subsp. variegata]KAF8024150.1 hypothetical protein BT93_F1367 [Corymbia citriodora subsp. variegata]
MDVNKIVGVVNNFFSLVRKVSNLSRVEAKTVALERNMEMVSARKADMILELEQLERRPGKKRKREVDLWMQRAVSLEDQVHMVGRKVRERRRLSRLMLAHQVHGLATEVDKLHEKGRFDNGLTLDVKPARGYELQPGELVRQASQTKRDEIWDCLTKEEVLRVGVWGQEGAGKTFLAEHIHDQIVRDCPRFDGACLVNVSQEGTVGTIQTDIANYLELDLTKVSCVYRGESLRAALQGKRLLLILDDVGKPYSLEEMGIGLERDGCKLIATSRSREVCEQMNCYELVHVPAPPEEEGLGQLEEIWLGYEAVDEYAWGR